MAGLNVIRVICQILSILFTIIGIAMISAGILSSAWQVMIEPGVGEIHQHGLWMDYVYSNRMHIAGVPNAALEHSFGGIGGIGDYGYGNSLSALGGGISGLGYYGYNLAPGGVWIMTYKFGSAVYGDDVHRAMPYQIYALVLLILAIIFALVGLFFSCCASVRPGFSIAWAVLLLFAVLLGSAALIQFYIASMLPEYRFVFTDRLVMQFVGYSYWYAVIGVILLGFGMIGGGAVAVIVAIMARRGEQPERPQIFVFRGKNGNSGGGGGIVKSVPRKQEIQAFRQEPLVVAPVHRGGNGNGGGGAYRVGSAPGYKATLDAPPMNHPLVYNHQGDSPPPPLYSQQQRHSPSHRAQTPV